MSEPATGGFIGKGESSFFHDRGWYMCTKCHYLFEVNVIFINGKQATEIKCPKCKGL